MRSFVRQHRLAHNIANGINVFVVGFQRIVGHNPATFVYLHAGVFESQSGCGRLAPYRHQHIVERVFFYLLVFVFDTHEQTVSGFFYFHHFRLQHYFVEGLRNAFLQVRHHVLIGTR